MSFLRESLGHATNDAQLHLWDCGGDVQWKIEEREVGDEPASGCTQLIQRKQADL